MEMLDFVGGVDIGQLHSHESGSVRERFTVPLREAASIRSLIIEDHVTVLDKRNIIDKYVHRIMGITTTPKLKKLSAPDLIHEIKKLQSSTKAGAVSDSIPDSAYTTVAKEDVEGQKQRAIEEVRERNESARIKALLVAIREEGATTQGAIAKYGEKVHSDINALQRTVAAIFNRKVGADDRYKKAMLTAQYTQESIMREQLEISKLTSRMVHEVGLKLIHNTSLPDIVKSTHAERIAILDEENMWRLNNALWQGNAESMLRNLNSAIVNSIFSGIGNTLTNLNTMGVDEQGNVQTRTGAVKNWVSNSLETQRTAAEARRAKFNETREREGWAAAHKELLMDIGSAIRDKAKNAGTGTVDYIKDKWNRGSDYYKNNTFGDMYAQAKENAKFHLLDEKGIARQWAINPVVNAGKSLWEAGAEAVGGKSDYELAVERTTGIAITIPDHLVKIHASIEKIYDSIQCVCDGKDNEAIGQKEAERQGQLSLDLPLPVSSKASRISQSVDSPKEPSAVMPKPETHNAATAEATVISPRPVSTDNTAEPRAVQCTAPVERALASTSATLTSNSGNEDDKVVVTVVPATKSTAQEDTLDTTLNAIGAAIDSIKASQRETKEPYTSVAYEQMPNTRKQYGQVDKSLYQPMRHNLTEDSVQSQRVAFRVTSKETPSVSTDAVDKVANAINSVSKTSSSELNKADNIIGVERASGHLMMFPEYRKMLMKLGKLSSTKLVPKEQAVLVDRATEQVALLAMISKKLEAGTMLEGLLGNKSNIMESVAGGALGTAGAALARGGAGMLMRLLPLALTPPGLLAMTVLAAYLGRDKIAETFKDIGTEISTAFETGKNMVTDAAHTLVGAESDNMRDTRERIEQGEATPEEISKVIASKEKLKQQWDVASTTARGPIGAAMSIGTRVWGSILKGDDYDDSSDTKVEENPTAVSDPSEPRAGNASTLTSGYTGALKNAKGEAYFLPDIDPYLVCAPGKDRKYMDRFNNLNLAFRGTFLGMAFEYNKLTGKKIIVNETYRTRAEQAAHHSRDPKMAAPPGGSMHELGLAIDASVGQNNALKECEEMGLMRKYGLWRPLRGELWHIEPIGIAEHIRNIKTRNIDEAGINNLILSHRGFGGSGAAVTGAKSRTGYRDVIKGGTKVGTAGKVDMNDLAKTAGQQNTTATDIVDTAKPSTNVPDSTASTPTPSKVSDVGRLGPVSTPVDNADSKTSDKPAVTGQTLHNVSFDKDPALYIVKKMMEHGWPEAAAVATAANAQQESSLNPKAVNPSSKAEGLFQWLGHRLEQYRKHVGKRPIDSSVDEQIKYLDFELRNGKKIDDPQTQEGGNKLAKESDPIKATEIFALDVERAGAHEAHLSQRKKYATDILSRMGKGTSALASAKGNTSDKPATSPSMGHLYGNELTRLNVDAQRSPTQIAQAPKPETSTVQSGFIKTSTAMPPPPPPPTMFNTSEINALLAKSHAVQTDMLVELRKLNAVFSKQPAMQSNVSASPAVETTKPSIRDRIRTNTISTTDQTGATI